MLICVTGATGLIGKQTCIQLLKLNFKVIAPVSQIRQYSIKHNNLKYVEIGDFRNKINWSPVLRKVKCIIHCAAKNNFFNNKNSNSREYNLINFEATRNLASQAANLGVNRFIFLSSIKVNGDKTTHNSKFKYSDPPNPQDSYGISKWKAEKALWKISSNTSMQVVVIRPPLVYGPEVKGNFLSLLNFVSNSFYIPVLKKNIIKSYVGIDNLVDFIICTMKHPKAAGQTFLISDGKDISLESLIKFLLERMGKSSYIFSVPSFIVNFFSKFLNQNSKIDKLISPMKIDISRNQKVLGWKPPINLEEGLSRTVQWYINNK